MSCLSNYYKLFFESFYNSEHTTNGESIKYSQSQSGEEIEEKSAAENHYFEIAP